MIEPIRIYQSERGVWHAEIKRGGKLKWFSLHTKDAAEANKSWQRYIAKIVPIPEQIVAEVFDDMTPDG